VFRRIGYIFLTGFICMVIGSVWAAEEFTPPIREVVVYTNDLAYIIRKGDATLSDGECVLGTTTDILGGSLSVVSFDPQIHVKEITASKNSVETHEPWRHLADFFRANIGKRLRVTTDTEKKEGILQGMAGDEAIILEDLTKKETWIYPLTQITGYTFLEPVKLQASCDKVQLRLRVDGAVEDQCSFGVNYLANGLSWSPHYHLALDGEEQGELSFKAIVRNQLEDLKGVNLRLVGAVPQLPIGLSPLVKWDDPTEPSVCVPPGSGLFTVNQFAEQKRLEFLSDNISVESVSSLTLYQQEGFSLKQGENAQISLFSGLVQVTPVYRLELYRASLGAELSKPEVWKGYRIANSSDFLWTAGPVFVTANNNPLGEVMLTTTPTGESAELKLTKDEAVLAKVSEDEFERVQGSLVYKQQEYALVQVSGQIELVNTKDEPILIRISHRVPGEVNRTSDDGSVKKSPSPVQGPNPQSVITWEISLPANGGKSINYTYQSYI
jgi:hypothetical protein